MNIIDIFRLCLTFEDLLTSTDKRFLNFFTPTVVFPEQGSESFSEMSKIPTSASRLAQPGTQSKRPREGSLDLEAGLHAKKTKTDTFTGPSTNLTKSKSKSMLSIAAGMLVKLHVFR